MNLAVRRSPIEVCVTNLWFTSAWRVCVTSLCDKCYASGCLPKSYRGLCDQFTFHSRVFYHRNSVLRFDLLDEWRDVKSLCDKCYECVLVPVLSCRGLCDQFTFHSRVFITYIRLGTPYGDLICVCDDSLYSVICGSVQMLWMRHWSSRLSALCLVELLTNGPVSLVPLVILPYVNRWYAFDGVV